jgi:hypothetical protein
MIPLNRKINILTRPFHQCLAFWIARSFVIDYEHIDEIRYLYQFCTIQRIIK